MTQEEKKKRRTKGRKARAYNPGIISADIEQTMYDSFLMSMGVDVKHYHERHSMDVKVRNKAILEDMLWHAEQLGGDAEELMSCAKVISDMANLIVVKAEAIAKGVSPEDIKKAISATD